MHGWTYLAEFGPRIEHPVISFRSTVSEPRASDLVVATPRGLYCAAGDFYVDPWEPVREAITTHAHGDHARPGSAHYVTAAPGAGVLAHRLEGANITAVPYGEPFMRGGIRVSLHPAGHVLGSAQVRIERDGEVWVISGDYKREPDLTCAPFEPLEAEVFITEATFGLPVYRWGPTADVVSELLAWWQSQAKLGRTAVLFCYTLGKAQRILAELARHGDRPIYVHGAVEEMTARYREAGVHLGVTERVVEQAKGKTFAGELVLAPLSARGTPWMKRLGDTSSGFASGWMRVRGERRRRNLERGFALSDHADFPALLRTVKETRARRVLVTHGYAEQFAHYLRDLGVDAQTLSTHFEGEPAE